MPNNSVIAQVCDHVGGQASLADKLGISRPTVNVWLADDERRRRPVPADRCPEIERLTAGKFTCEKLRPDLRWARIADAKWAWHRRGRPVLDLTREAA